MSYGFFDKLKHSFARPSPFVRREGRELSQQLLLIVSCAGWGKTAFLSQLAEDNENSVCFSAGAEDNSCERVITLLSEALPQADIAPEDSAFEAVCKAAFEG